jgi:hypothetical protein
MSRTKRNEKLAAAAQKRAEKAAALAATAQARAREAATKIKPAAEQMKPLARSTKEAAGRGLRRSRAWAAPQIEHAGQVLQDNVAPKVSDALASAARKIEPDKPKTGRLRALSIVSVVLAAAASAVAALARKRKAQDEATEPEPGPNGQVTSTQAANTSEGAAHS